MRYFRALMPKNELTILIFYRFDVVLFCIFSLISDYRSFWDIIMSNGFPNILSSVIPRKPLNLCKN
eukprot:TRINITY_DN6992_c0_g1_i1.p1 TRINITY_DN6992_c0_g1~~TRINITY_DN6992_c0_g1_i1.p1  ORF type:complete len:66 (-),score=7.04 TRINITY_DN6992_c0_g1_i1:300-497(-)